MTKYRVFWFENGKKQSMECATFADTKMFAQDCGISQYSLEREKQTGSGWVIIRHYDSSKKVNESF